MNGSILIVDDDRPMCELLKEQLVNRGFHAEWRESAPEALDALNMEEYEAVVTDLNMPGMGGIQFIEQLKVRKPDIPVLVITSFGSMDTAVAALRAGAYDFITKPFEVEILALSLSRAISHQRLREEVQMLRDAAARPEMFEELMGSSPEITKVFERISKAAKTDVTVLITGESGTGKELVARALHRRSDRREGPFVAVNCAAMPETLLESELFGHVKGAFTDAKTSRTGLFVKANDGTLFLDEIGEMPIGLQPKILRALEEHALRPLGGDVEIGFNARIVAATNRDLSQAVDERQFREELYYRINVVNIALPPLRSRGNDILTLAQSFVEHFAVKMNKATTGLTTKVADKLLSYPWPGNVRELKNSMEHAVALTSTVKIIVEDLPDRIRNYRSSHIIVAGENPTELASMEEVERRYIDRVLTTVNGNKALAARILGFDRKTLYRKLERYTQTSSSSRTDE